MLQVVTAQNGSGQNWYRQNGIQRRKIMKYLFPRKNDCCFTSTLPARRALPKMYASMASPPLMVQTTWYTDKMVLNNIVGTK